MVNKVFISDRGIIEIWVIGHQTYDSVREMGEKIGRYVQEQRAAGVPVLILDNIIDLGTTTSDARREVARLAKTLTFDRAAMVGNGSRAMRFGTNLMLHAIGRSNTRYFSHLYAAEDWLLDYAAQSGSGQPPAKKETR